MSAVTATPRRSLRLERYAAALILLLAVALYVGIIILRGQQTYLTLTNLVEILGRSITLGITAIGQTFVILVGSIDLSVASLISAAAVVTSVVMNGNPAMTVPAILAVLALGAVVGLVNGLIITRLEVNPLIATLGMSLVIQGVLSAFYNNFAGAVPPEFQGFAYGAVGIVPYSLIFMFALAALAWVILRFTRFGSNIYSVGGNRDAARLAGVQTGRVIIATHVICSLCAAIAGMYLASRLRAGNPQLGADGAYDLESIAVVVIGGTVLAGGRGGVWGTIAGVLIFSLIDSIFNVAGVDAFLKQMLRGIIIVAAVAIYSIRSRRPVS